MQQNEQRMKTYVANLSNQTWTYSEFETETAYWALENIDNYYKQSKPYKPRELIDFELLPFKEKTIELRQRTFANFNVINYFKKCAVVTSENTSNYYWLKQYKSILQKDEVTIKKIDHVLSSYFN